jgi:hypothetical protein
MKKPKKGICEENEREYLRYIREYYREEFKNGEADESFLLWIEEFLNKDNRGKI